MRSEADYLSMLQALLPPGIAWPREADATLTQVLRAQAAALAALDARAEDLLDEADPRTAFELLSEWEQVAGLPDPCTGGADTIQERRLELVERLTGLGGQSRAHFIALAERLGYAGATIDEFQPFIAGLGRCNDDLLNGGHAVRFHWRVRVPGPRVTLFRAGASRCGDTLADIERAEDLECLFGRLKPAHSTLIFSYEGV